MFKFRIWNNEGEYVCDAGTAADAIRLVACGFEGAALVRKVKFDQRGYLIDAENNLINMDGTIVKKMEV